MIKKEVSYIPAVLIGIGIAVIGLAIIFLIASSGSTGIDDCRKTSATTAEYRGCIAVEQCRSDFKGNSQLIGSCIADVIIRSIE